MPCPLQVRAADVQLPAGATFVVANSLTVSKKAETADRRCAGAQTWSAGVQAVPTTAAGQRRQYCM